MSHLPQISGEEAVKCFEKIGYRVARQRGSHIRLYYSRDDCVRKPLTVPNHKELGRGLLRKLIRDANISVENFLKLL
jgi:predicted RNA binding protein YcfA (HicA-like mRNA interferase family)